MPPAVYCIVGKKKSGKTTTTVGLIRELVSRGHLVGSAKHGHHFELDHEGKDSYRHRHEGGAVATVLSGPEGVAATGKWPSGEQPLAELVSQHLSHVHIVVAEGYKSSKYARFEVFRSTVHAAALYGTDDTEQGEYLAVLTDVPDFTVAVPVIDVDDPQRFVLMADLVEAHLGGQDT